MAFDDSVIDPLDRAAYDTVHEFVHPTTGRRGATALAPVIGMPSSTLSNTVNPFETLRDLGIKTARAIMLASGDKRILHQLAHDLGESCIPLPTLDFPADSDLMAAWAEWQVEVAHTVESVRDALADSRVTQAEVALVREELVRDFELGLQMLGVLRGMAEPD